MTLSSITITGFKSFAKKTTIDISRNVTGIVGPNGSGKSNVAEAIRFVLGEQSMKSIRSKSMGDLIFKGSSTLGSLSRASVSITIDNKNKSASRGVSEEIAPFLAYDEIVLSREVYIDGGSTYKINNTDVRLKDVQAILALAGIGTSVHTIISQGEADRILLVSAEERKEMIQDALGLRVHEMRLKESERKLAKVEEHMKTVSLMRRELAPELNHLRIQIEKISKVEEEREKLLNNYILYFVYESKLISDLKSKTKNYASNTERLTQIEEEKRGLAKREEDLELRRRSGAANKKVKEEERYTLERALAEVTYQKNLLKNELEKIPTHASISKTDYEKFKNEIKRLTDELEIAISNNDQNKTRSLIGGINHTIEHQFPEFSQVGRTDDIQRQIAECVSKENDIKNKIQSIANTGDNAEDNNIEELRSIYDKRQSLEREILEIEKLRDENQFYLKELEEKDRLFAVNLQEAVIFVGQKVLNYHEASLPTDYNHYNNQKSLERSKIRIEEMGIIDVSSIKMQYEEMNARNTFLENEINDLTNTKASLDTLIADLRVTIKTDFEKGLEKINFTFANFFHNIFPGGKAKLILVENKIEREGEETELKTGVDLDISLPQKKVKDINMLSGGEKTLSSIALLFALTSIVPPPFMVLDETDAALDESNARKYGKLLSKLAEKSRLLVITHNRETMNQCDILYGITLGGDGGSRILSIKFDK
jgi:chromosome segregation protein